ncbi:MAG: cobyric acid synthase CobQ [Cereibacter sphaeroides]|uniref:Cobyric acid synthase n=1 Tax=Cereibacter sphaeroides TaxID=1063 RepID=A0A2W5SER4_CERSP|nr:MAG: cobyric acid synthase CobQ [Cereibacter sphaeroides]
MSSGGGSALMIQGAGSNVGKSLLVAGICRALTLRGYSVRPFKPQNMSNNAAVTVDGGEIGRAQALQALACRVEPHTDMNPVLLKPESETGSQIIVQGKRWGSARARDYAAIKAQLMAPVLDSFARLRSQADIMIVEGAGSPAEVNLRANDIANMGFARASGTPVVLAGDIDRGGVIAQMVGTAVVLDPADAAMIKGFIVNKFRGDVRLFDDGRKIISDRTGWRDLGLVPWFPAAHRLPAEDALDIADTRGRAGLKIVCLQLSRIANFDDLDPLAAEPGVSLTMLRAGEVLTGDADLVIIPGSKSTRGDLAFLREQGWDVDILAHVRRGGRILGLCGGYQMLGRLIRDPEGLEGTPGETPGLDLLDLETTMSPEKRLSRVSGTHLQSGLPFSGYEIHLGRTEGPALARAFATVDGAPEGAVSGDGRVIGTYLHGIFTEDAFRSAFLSDLGLPQSELRYGEGVEATLNDLAAHVEASLDMEALITLARSGA